MQQPEEEKKQVAPREEAVEYIDTSSNPQPSSVQQPAEVRATVLRKVQTAEKSKTEAFMTAKADNPEARRIKMAEQMRRSKRQQLVSKKRWDLAMNQVQREEEQYFELAFSHLPEEPLDPFAAPPIFDLDHNIEFSTKYPEVADE